MATASISGGAQVGREVTSAMRSPLLGINSHFALARIVDGWACAEIWDRGWKSGRLDGHQKRLPPRDCSRFALFPTRKRNGPLRVPDAHCRKRR